MQIKPIGLAVSDLDTPALLIDLIPHQDKTPPVLRDYPDCHVIGLSPEHASIALDPPNSLQIGEKLHIIPGYSDFTFVLHDRVIGLHHGDVTAA